jgi:hypothetical protein
MPSTDLEQRLLVLESTEAIRTLRCRYHELVNEDEGRRLYELFAPDATVAYGVAIAISMAGP